MKIVVSVVCMAILSLVLTEAHAGSCKKVFASAHPDYAPYHWRMGSKIVGASVDITREILAAEGVELITQYRGPWKRTLKEAEQGRIDLLLGLKETQERSQFLEFTTSPILPNPFAVFVRQDKHFVYSDWRDLIGKDGGRNSGDRFGDSFDRYAKSNLKIQPAPTVVANVKKLQSGRIDYLIHGRYVGRAQFARMKEAEGLIALGRNINEGVVHSGFVRTSKCTYLNAVLSAGYHDMLQSGKAMEILERNVRRWANVGLNNEKN